jgi:hypothetical protein
MAINEAIVREFFEFRDDLFRPRRQKRPAT